MSSFELAWSGNREQVARMTGMFRSLPKRDQQQFLAENGLQFKVQDSNNVDSLQISPARVGVAATVVSPRVSARAKAALRLVEDDNTISQTVPGKPLMNVSGVRFTDEDMQSWFKELDVDNNGYLSKTEFRVIYDQLEQFGTPVKERWIEEQLKKMKAFDDERLSFAEFAYLLTHVAAR